MSSRWMGWMALAVGAGVAVRGAASEWATHTAISIFDEGECLLCWVGETQAVERSLLVALHAAEQARLKPWWLPELDEFTPTPRAERERRALVEAVLNEIVPRYVVARYPARLGRYDHDQGGFPLAWVVRTVDWRFDSRLSQYETERVYTYSMLSGLDPVDPAVFRKGLPAEWGNLDELSAMATVPVLARCSPEEGRRIRAREQEARIELILAVPARWGDRRTISARPPLPLKFHVKPRVYPVVEAALVSPEGERFPLFRVTGEELQPLATSVPPTPAMGVPREEVAQYVEAEVERRWQDIRTRCPNCGGRKQCPRCDGRGYLLGVCRRCNGTGQIEVKCELCQGTGRLGDRSCYACWAGRRLLFCPDCDDPVHGQGKVRLTCPECGRTGRCPRCGGTGRVSPE